MARRFYTTAQLEFRIKSSSNLQEVLQGVMNGGSGGAPVQRSSSLLLQPVKCGNLQPTQPPIHTRQRTHTGWLEPSISV